MVDALSRRLGLGVIALATVICVSKPGRASPNPTTPGGESQRPHSVHAEYLGRGGLYGIGYSYNLDRYFMVTAVASFYKLEGEYHATASPSLGYYLFRRSRHRIYSDLGPRYAMAHMSSPVPRWPGSTSHGLGGQISVGYEYRNRVVIRNSLSVLFGKYGATPWGGSSIGVEW
ncbi:MAG: hypothetical protein GY811_18125 [Myxococcales bacterium]|nr:hypothetical protein [Myxococcales bacterium]